MCCTYFPENPLLFLLFKTIVFKIKTCTCDWFYIYILVIYVAVLVLYSCLIFSLILFFRIILHCSQFNLISCLFLGWQLLCTGRVSQIKILFCTLPSFTKLTSWFNCPLPLHCLSKYLVLQMLLSYLIYTFIYKV